MSSETSAAAAQPEKQPEVPAMEAIDEDDEFEEFKIECTLSKMHWRSDAQYSHVSCSQRGTTKTN